MFGHLRCSQYFAITNDVVMNEQCIFALLEMYLQDEFLEMKWLAICVDLLEIAKFVSITSLHSHQQ